MDQVMVSAAEGVMGSLLQKLGSLLLQQHSLLSGVQDRIRFLKAELESMHAFLQELGKLEEPSALVKGWMKEVRELAYDIEDCIDEFMLRVHHESNMPNGFMGLLQRCMNLMTTAKTRHEIATEIQGLQDRVVEAAHRRKRYKLDEAIAKHSSVDIDPRVRALYVEAADLVGIDGPRDELIKWLTEGETQELKVVSIVGFGGLGKTTLANEVYRKLGGQFECRAFVSVSQKPDLKKIFRTILSQVSQQGHADMEAWDEEQLIRKLREFLEHKRYFIIIDDIWSIPTWRHIKCALLENNRGSRIMTTTRIIAVAKSCCSPHGDRVCEMKPLSTIDSRKLFIKRIFGSEDRCPTQLKEVSNEILKKCSGLPLAIITIASLLASKASTKEHWERVRNSIGSALERNPDVEEMKRILSLSYNDLPHYLKTCLLYLSTFPEDYKIKRDRLVRRWIAEGFINVEGGQNLEVGECYFNELINRSMIQPVDVRYDGRAKACRVHDMILDLIISKSVEENFITLFGDQKHTSVPQSKVRRLSLNYHDQEHVMVPSTMILSHVRSLTIFGYAEQMPPFLDFRALRVLDLQDSEQLENHHLKNIERLFQLKYLGLRETHISELPKQIGELQYLETLDLRWTTVREVPQSIVRLRQLVCLLVDNVKLLDGIGNMQALQELLVINVCSSCSVISVQELGNLTKLRTLRINWSVGDRHSDIGTYRDNLVSSLNKLGGFNLRSLRVDSAYGCSLGFLLDSWSPPPYLLQKFEVGITDYYFPRIPEWLALLPNLTILDISVNQVGERDFLVAGDLPALLLLRIRPKLAPEETLTIGSKGFQCLKELFFGGLCGMGLIFEAGAMPKLERLEIWFNARETKSLHGGFDLGIQRLSCCLKQVEVKIDCRGAKRWEVEAAEAAIRNATNILPNHPTLEFHRWGEWGMIKADKEIEEVEDGEEGESREEDDDTKQEDEA